MLKKLLFHILVGGSIFVVGGCLHDFYDYKDLGSFIAYSGIIYASVTTILILLFGINIPSPIRDKSDFSLLNKVRNGELNYTMCIRIFFCLVLGITLQMGIFYLSIMAFSGAAIVIAWLIIISNIIFIVFGPILYYRNHIRLYYLIGPIFTGVFALLFITSKNNPTIKFYTDAAILCIAASYIPFFSYAIFAKYIKPNKAKQAWTS